MVCFINHNNKMRKSQHREISAFSVYERYQASQCLILSISCRRQLTICERLTYVADKQRSKPFSDKKRKAQKQRKSSVSELFDLVTRTGIENLGALFVTCCDIQKSSKIRHFRTIYKSPFILFFAKFLHP